MHIKHYLFSSSEFRWKRKQGNLYDLLQNSGITFLIMQWYDEENRQRIRAACKVVFKGLKCNLSISYQFEKTTKRSTAINMIIIATRALRIPRHGRSFDYPSYLIFYLTTVQLHQLVSKSLSKYAAKTIYQFCSDCQ